MRKDSPNKPKIQEIFRHSKNDEKSCEPLTPNGSPFKGFLEEQTAPIHAKRYFLDFATDPDNFDMSTGSISQNHQLSETLYGNAIRPRMYSSQINVRKSSEKVTASAMLKDLKRKLLNSKSHKRNHSAAHIMYSLFDRVSTPNKNFS